MEIYNRTGTTYTAHDVTRVEHTAFVFPAILLLRVTIVMETVRIVS